jgi:hypothetical protein
LKEILIRFLVSLDAFTDDELAIELRRIRQTADSSPRSRDIRDDGYELSRKDRYSCARFVKHLAEANSPHVQHLSKLVAVGLLTEVVDDFVKPISVVSKSETTLIFQLRQCPALKRLSSGADFEHDDRFP